MSDQVDRFCAFYHPYHGISPSRQVMQRRVLLEFEATAGDPTAAGATELRDFLASRMDSGLSPNTVRQYLGAIRPFYRWLWQERVITAEQLMQIQEVSPPRGSTGVSTPHPYNRTELRQFWEALEDHYPWAHDSTDRARGEYWLRRWELGLSRWSRVQPYAKRLQIEAIVHLALHGGLRRNEIFGLDLEAMDYDNAYVVVQGARKNAHAESKPRGVPFTGEMRQAVKEWLVFRESLGPSHDRPWLSLHTSVHYLKPMRIRQFQGLLGNVGRGYELHRLRHTFATEQLRAGLELAVLSRIMGHSRIEQTLGYAELVRKDLVDAAERTEGRFTTAIRRAA